MTKESVTKEPVVVWPLLLYGLSGFTALAYEVLWMRLVSTLSGASNFGLVATLIAFMAGLGLGSGLGARLRMDAVQALRLFGVIEISVSLVSLFMPDAASFLEQAFEAVAGHLGMGGWMAFHVAACVLLLLLPATGLGLTFPAMLRALEQTNAGVARIYGYNTLGGVAGALAPLALLPWLGWAVALRLIAGAGLLTGAVAIALSSAWKKANTGAYGETAGSRPAWGELAAYAGVGAAALILEVGWTRLYSAVFMRTEYVLGVILAVVLLGIALGSLISRRIGAGALGLIPLVAALASLLPLALLPRMAAWMESNHFSSLFTALSLQGLVMAAVTILATMALGAWLPLIVRRQRKETAAAWLYAANSLGAAVGALSAGWILIPWFGSNAAVCVAAATLALCGLYWCTRRARILMLLAMPAIALAWNPPTVARMLPHQYGNTRELFRFEDAVSMTHVVARPNGVRILLNNLQRVDASTDPTAVAVQKNQGRLPLLFHPGAKTALFLGLGTGITASVAHQVAGVSATAVELSEGAILAAGEWFGRFNGDTPQWLDVRHDDARRFLKTGTGQYDVIVGDLFHPDMAGRGLLLSLQQFARVRDRLSPTGVYVQWLALNQFDMTSLRIVLATFHRIFPRNTMLLDGFHLALAGFRGPLPRAGAIRAWARKHGNSLTGGEGWQTWLGRDLGPIPDLDTSVQDEWAPVVEFRLARARVEGRLDVAAILDWLLHVRPKPEFLLHRWHVAAEDAGAVAGAALATDAMMHAWEAMFSGRSRSVPQFLRLAYEANTHDRWAGFALADAMVRRLERVSLSRAQMEKGWRRVLSVRPDHVPALRALWHLLRAHGDRRQAAGLLIRLRKLAPLDPEVLTAQH